jgi:hypothetical protein
MPGPVIIRVNTVGGGFRDVATNSLDWAIHDDADVAAIWFATLNETDDIQPIPTEWFVGAGPDYRFTPPMAGLPVDKLPKMNVLIGHDVSIPSLLVQDPGAERNLPVLRFGKVARMPSLINLKRFKDDATKRPGWLIELQSWGGVSGSPVVWRYPLIKHVRDVEGRVRDSSTGGIEGILGLLSGHFEIGKDVKPKKKWLPDPELLSFHNVGIAMVTPSEAILQLLNSYGFEKLRQDTLQALKKSQAESSVHDGSEPFLTIVRLVPKQGP